MMFILLDDFVAILCLSITLMFCIAGMRIWVLKVAAENGRLLYN